MSNKVSRLFEQFKPTNYKISLSIDHDELKFSGSVLLQGQKTGRPTQRITLHQKDLKIKSATLTYTDKKKATKQIPISRINCHNSFEELRLHSEQMLYPGTYEIKVDFEGEITRPMDGIYPCFFEYEGKKQYLIATQFESHHARQAFPCIDEPEAKATFDLELKTTEGLTTIANTPIKSQKSTSNKTTTVFETTPIMSTYLLAFVSGNMGYTEAKSASGTLVRAYATPENVQHTDFALETAVKCLDFYEEYFDIPYPLAKCDLVALPDFASGAMENWGCITFREQTMLVDPAHTSLTTKQFAGLVVAHELAHQWFGNLVTMRWWTDLWLNEGFASWVEYMAINQLFPQWQLWTQFLVDDREQALKLDALENTHSIEVPVHHPDEIRTIFDAISYSKGASVINMLHDYLGHEDFQNGLRHYLKTHAYKNTDTTDLWQALEDVSKKDVKSFMHSWTSQPGFPIVKVSQEANRLLLQQNRFYLRQPEKHSDDTWPVPLLCDAADTTTLNTHSAQVTLKNSDTALINSTQNGFYRVSYSAEMLKSHAKLVSEDKMPIRARLGILSDSFESAKAGQMPTVDVLELLSAYSNEDNAAVWDIIASGLATVRAVMDSDELRELMSPYVIELTKKQMARLGWNKIENESHFDTLLRPIILAMAAVAEEPSVIAKCRELFKQMHESDDIDPALTQTATVIQLKRGAEIDPDMRGVVYGTVARHGGEAEFNKLLQLHETTNNSEERINIAAALTGFRQPELIDRALALIPTDFVRLQDVAYWIAYSLMNRYARDAAWKWLKDNWSWMEQNFAGDLGFYRMPVYASRSFSDENFVVEFKKFFEPKRSPAFNRSIDQGLEIIEWHTAWRKRDLNSIIEWFKAH